jgi:hypothetical protein
MVLAWLLASLDAVWYVAMETLPGITLGQALPIGLAWLWIGVALFLTGRHLAHVRQALVDVARLPLIDDARRTQEAAGLARSMGVGIPSLRLGACSTMPRVAPFMRQPIKMLELLVQLPYPNRTSRGDQPDRPKY